MISQSTWHKHRYAGAIIVCFLAYTLFGFLIVPWLASGIATKQVRDALGADLQVDDISFNPFTFVVTIEGVALDDAAGDKVARVDFVRANFDPTGLPRRAIEFSTAEVRGPSVRIRRAADGELNLASLKPHTQGAPRVDEVDDKGNWRLAIEEFDLEDMSVEFIDETIAPRAELGFSDLELSATGITTQPDSPFPVDLSLRLSTGGTIAADGRMSLAPAPAIEFAVTLDDVSLELLHPYVRPLADITWNSGAVNFDGDIASTPEEPFTLAGDAVIVELLMTESDVGTRLASWKQVSANGIALGLGEHSLSISEIIADSPYADILIAEDGTVNLARAGKDPESGAEPATAAAEPRTPDDQSNSEPFDVIIGRILIRNGAAAFDDRSLPLPFTARIHELNGELSTIATGNSEPAQIELEGRVDEYGQVVVSGSVTPLEPAKATDIRVDFDNVEMPKFSAYSIRFAGHEIASGKLDLELHYTVTGARLAGENAIVLHDFELGDKVPHPGAADLPLGLAVALLKDASGRISVDLPVRGDLDDPQFRIGGVIASALGNLVTGIVASPFKLLGKLIGADPDELEVLYFAPGSAELSPPQLETVAKLAEVLGLRPQLVLELAGAWVEAADALALREQAVDEALEAAIEATGDTTPYAERRVAATETLFRERVGTDVPPETDDPVARAADMRRQIIDAETVPDGALEALADQRAVNTRVAILDAAPGLESRIVLLSSEQVRRLTDDNVGMKVRLSTRID